MTKLAVCTCPRTGYVLPDGTCSKCGKLNSSKALERVDASITRFLASLSALLAWKPSNIGPPLDRW